MWVDYEAMIQETIRIAEQGHYTKNGETKNLKTSLTEREEVILVPPEEYLQIVEFAGVMPPTLKGGTCQVSMSSKDTFEAAMELIHNRQISDTRRVLVLNFANPVQPGGGVLDGAKAQEEDLCRKSTLYQSLRTEKARAMYEYNQILNDYRSSDYMLLSPNVEIFRDPDNGFLDETAVVGVLTAAAPISLFGIGDKAKAQLNLILRFRIREVLSVAAAYKYLYLVLGAWGCGAFGNDAAIVAKMFYEEIKNFRKPSGSIDDCFESIVFAVLNPSRTGYNYKYFEKYFGGGL